MRKKNYSRWLDTKHCIWKSAEDDYWLAPATKSFFFQYQDTKFISKRTHFWNANLRRNVLMYLINCVQVVAKPFQTQTATYTKKCRRNEMTRERKWMSIENEDETENICQGSNRAANEALANSKWDRCMRSIIRKKKLNNIHAKTVSEPVTLINCFDVDVYNNDESMDKLSKTIVCICTNY